MVTYYYRLKDRNAWHFHPECHHLKAAIDALRMFGALRDTKPRSGEFCNECLAKDWADASRRRMALNARADKRRAAKASRMKKRQGAGST